MKEKMVIGLCDDEKVTHEVVKKYIENYGVRREIDIRMIDYYSAEKLCENQETMDCLLLDIDMPKMDGIEVGYQLMEQDVKYKIVMLTAKEDRYRDAFKIGAFRFVPKPIDESELFSAIDDVRKYTIATKYEKAYRNGISYNILQKDIFFVEANHSETIIYTSNLEYRSEESLAEWEKKLDNRLFFKTHKSYIVNMRCIKEIKANVLYLENGDRVLISRRLRNDFLRTYMNFDTCWR